MTMKHMKKKSSVWEILQLATMAANSLFYAKPQKVDIGHILQFMIMQAHMNMQCLMKQTEPLFMYSPN